MKNKYQEALKSYCDGCDYEENEGFCKRVEGRCKHYKALQELVDKEKAFDIIKSKKVSVWLLFESDSVEGYNAWTKGEKLTQEEFDYLREKLV